MATRGHIPGPPLRGDPRVVERLAIVEDSPALVETLRGLMAPRARQIEARGTIHAAARLLTTFTPDAVLLDVCLPDGTALDLLPRLLEVRPTPVVIAMSGSASPGEAFRLAQQGVRGYLAKPIDVASLDRVWADALDTPPEIEPLLRATVGHLPIRDVERSVRETMVDEAVARSRGNRRGAARLLSVSRQLLQHMLRSLGKDDPGTE